MNFNTIYHGNCHYLKIDELIIYLYNELATCVIPEVKTGLLQLISNFTKAKEEMDLVEKQKREFNPLGKHLS